MKRHLTIVFALASLVVMASCSGTPENAVNTPEPAPPILAPAEYTNADQALADGIRLLDAGDTERAIEVLNRAVELNPDLAEAHFRLGIAWSLIEFRDMTAAQETVGPTPEASPGEKKPKERKSNSELAFERAVAAYKKIIDANPEDHNAFYNLGRAYNKLNEDEDAAKALRQAVKLNPEDTEYQTELGVILIKLAKYSEAVAALKKAVELDPQNLEAEELLERAEAGAKRIAFTKLPEERSSNTAANTSASNTDSNSNSAAPPPVNASEKPGSTPRPAATPTTKPKS